MADQGDAYSKFVEAELKNERERRSALDQRGLGVVTSSSAFITLVFSLSVILTGKDFTPKDGVRNFIAASLVSFVVAGALGIFANANRRYHVATRETLDDMLGEHWIDDEVDARNNVAALNVVTLDTLRTGNSKKVWFLSAALVFQVIAIASLGAAVVAQIGS